jgi:hypothetical protein
VAQCPSYNLGQIVDKFLIRKFNDKRKNFTAYLSISQDVWRNLFLNTLYVTKNVWIEVQRGRPYNFIYVPKDCYVFVKASVEDKKRIYHGPNINRPKHCNTLVPLQYNSSINVIPQPMASTCGCGKSCSALCGDINSWTATTKPVIFGTTTYYEKTWLRYCSNGDIISYREIPTKQYTSVVNDGDFNNDYNNDYSIGSPPPFPNYTVVTQISEEIICKLKTKECGCPDDSPENIQTFNEHCGCHTPYWNHCNHNECYEFQEQVNDHHYGEMKFSNEGDKIYLKRLRKGTKYVLLTYQTDGTNIDEQVQVPSYCENVMFAAIDYAAKQYNDKFPVSAKDAAWYNYIKEVNLLIKLLNRISMTFLQNLQAAAIRW